MIKSSSPGEIPKWLKGSVSKTDRGATLLLGFESLFLRHLINTPLIYLQGRFLYEDKVMDGKYRKVTISTYDVPEKRYITIDKLQVDDPVKTIDILSDNYLDEDGNFSLLSITFDNDPSGFFIELDRLRK